MEQWEIRKPVPYGVVTERKGGPILSGGQIGRMIPYGVVVDRKGGPIWSSRRLEGWSQIKFSGQRAEMKGVWGSVWRSLQSNVWKNMVSCNYSVPDSCFFSSAGEGM